MARAIDRSHEDQLKAQPLADRDIARRSGEPLGDAPPRAAEA
jgi:hypothetical protein